MERKVLVTGGAGYLGAILSERLLDGGFHVTVLDNLTYGVMSLAHLCHERRFRFERGDVRDRRVLERLVREADVIIPLAALVGAPLCDRDPWAARATNLEAIRALNEIRGRDQRIVFPTTNSGYGAQSGDVFCTEETALEPISLYGRLKADAERELLASPNAITLRLATLFGMSPRLRLDLLVNHFVYAAVTEGYLVIFEKQFKRNFVHVRDAADCFVHCLDRWDRMVGRPYNVGLDSANLSKEELALKIREYVPQFYIHFSEVGSDPDKRNYIVSNARLREAGFEARRTLDEGIQELIQGYRLLAPGPWRNV